MPRVTRYDLLSSVGLGSLAISILALACSHVALNGGPAWIEGQELVVFIKLAIGAAVLVAVDVCWKARAS